MQNMLKRQPGAEGLNTTSEYGPATVSAVKLFQASSGLTADGVVGDETASAILETLAYDGYRDDGAPPSASGHLFKILFLVPRNRSVEVDGSLLAANGSVVYKFRARLHGVDSGANGNDDDTGCPPGVWPAFSSKPGLNEFSPCGNTPTGLAEADLNSPEDEPSKYGPYPVVRMVQGLQGNAGFLVPGIRDGILVHTGAWPGWSPGETMPNSEGCIHSEPDFIKTIWQTLVSLGVKVNTNTGGKLPYPYKPQGLISIVQSF
jgi:hypothetical protein